MYFKNYEVNDVCHIHLLKLTAAVLLVKRNDMGEKYEK